VAHFQATESNSFEIALCSTNQIGPTDATDAATQNDLEKNSKNVIQKLGVLIKSGAVQNTNQYQILKCESLSVCLSGMFEIDNENEIELQYAQEGRTVVFFAIDKQVTGVIALSITSFGAN
jgi:negative regulator of replication initiation